MNLPIGSKSVPQLVFQSPYGHETTNYENGPVVVWGTESVTMPTPADHGLLSIQGGSGAYFTYLAAGSGVNWSAPVLPNDGGVASIALRANPPSNQWAVRKTCWADEQVAAEQVVTISPGGSPTTLDFSGSPC